MHTRYTFVQSLWPYLFCVCVAVGPVCVGDCFSRCVCGPRRHVDTRVLAVTTVGGVRGAVHVICHAIIIAYM